MTQTPAGQPAPAAIVGAGIVRCSRCGAGIPPGRYGPLELDACDRCGARLAVRAYPALVASRPGGGAGQALADDSQASCFHHPGKQAVAVCDQCGRFMCGLCEIDLGQRRLCPACYQVQYATPAQAGKAAPTATRPISSTTFYDSVAILLAVLPVLVTPPAAIYLAIRHWNTKMSVLPRTRVRHVLAIILALVQIGLWVMAFTWESGPAHSPYAVPPMTGVP